MFFWASLLQGMISIACVKVISGTATENLQLSGLDTPRTAISDNDAAPFQYHNRRAFFKTTSWPLRDTTVPA
jgi:hypothetical protein